VRVCYNVVVKKFTFAISSPDEFLVLFGTFFTSVLLTIGTAAQFLKPVLSVLSACLVSVCHTRNPLLKGSRYRNAHFAPHDGASF